MLLDGNISAFVMKNESLLFSIKRFIILNNVTKIKIVFMEG